MRDSPIQESFKSKKEFALLSQVRVQEKVTMRQAEHHEDSLQGHTWNRVSQVNSMVASNSDDVAAKWPDSGLGLE